MNTTEVPAPPRQANPCSTLTAASVRYLAPADGEDVDRAALRRRLAGGAPVDYAAPAPAAPVTNPGAAGVTPTAGTNRATLTYERHGELLRRDAFDELRAAGFDHCPDCYIVRTDGVCGWCRQGAILNADPDWRAMSDAQARLDFEPFVSFEASRADEQTVAAFERKVARAERDAVTDPNACGKCGRPEGRHFRSRFTGICRYVPPSDAQRLARMYARRAARLGLPVWQRPGRQHTAQCPYCGGQVPGLLSGCDKAECRRREIAADVAFDRAADQ